MPPTKVYKFGHFKLNTVERLLLRDDLPVSLTPKAFETLVALVSRSGHLVEKDELLKEVWPDTFVEESNLSRIIYLLRKALEEDTEEARFIETVPRRGYRFIAPVEENFYEDAPDLIIRQQRTRAHIIIEEETEPPQSAAPVTIPTERKLSNPDRTSRLTLQRSLIAALVIALIGVATYIFFQTRKNKEEANLTQIKTIAVLPFKPLGVEGGDELLGLGMADAIIIKLTASHLFSVLPTSTVYSFTKRDYNSLAAGKELGVDAVLDGTIQRSNNQMRVTAQLVDVRNGQTIWSEKFDRNFTDIFKLQDSISEQMANTLSRQITDDQRAQLKKWSTANPEAYQSYLMGLYFYNQRTEEGFDKAINYFQEAIRLDPNYARAYAVLSEAIHLSVYYGFKSRTQSEELVKARNFALKALELDPNLAEANLARGNSQLVYEKDYEGALASYKKAVEQNPSFATAYQRYSWLLMSFGRPDDALAAMRRAQELDPLSKTNNGALAQVLIMTRHYDEALKYAQRALELDANSGLFRLILGEAYLGIEKYEDALNQFQAVKGSQMDLVSARESIGYVEAKMGHREEAQKILDELQKDSGLKEYISPISLIGIYNALGEKEQAFKLLEEAGQKDALPMLGLEYDLRLDPMRSDPRFKTFVDSYQSKFTSKSRNYQNLPPDH